MASHLIQQCNRAAAPGNSGEAFAGQPLSEDQLGRWAALIVDEKGPLPQGLPVEDRQRLMIEVRRRLRERLARGDQG
jgi:hypothetical protein